MHTLEHMIIIGSLIFFFFFSTNLKTERDWTSRMIGLFLKIVGFALFWGILISYINELVL